MSKESVIIRRANPSDLERLRRIEVECFHEEAFPLSYLRYIIENPNFIMLVAVLEGEIAGFIVASIEDFRDSIAGHIYSIDVKPKYRRRGIGSKLLESIEEILGGMGAEVCYLEARADNVAAINLYLKCNYRALENLRNYYGVGKNGIRLAKKLKDEKPF